MNYMIHCCKGLRLACVLRSVLGIDLCMAAARGEVIKDPKV
jgi:hypothetical protein